MASEQLSELPYDSGAEVNTSSDLGASRLAGQICRHFHKLDDCFALLLDRIKAFFATRICTDCRRRVCWRIPMAWADISGIMGVFGLS